MTKGYRHGRKSKERLAKEALKHAAIHSFNDRRKKKGDFRKLWITRLNGALQNVNESYSKFFDKLKKNKIELNRKVMAEIAKDNPAAFNRIVEKLK